MSTTIRQLQGEEMLDALYALGQYSFRPSPPFQDKEEWLEMARHRRNIVCYGVIEEGRPAAVAVSSPMTQNMRGALYPASGVWGVATDPSARRKGYSRRVLTSLLAAERENGKVFSNLYPFRESFYQKLGYVTYPLTKIAKFSPSALAPLLELDLPGEIELKMTGEGYETYRQYLAELRQSRHGMLIFDFGDQAMANRNRLWIAFARFAGEIEGVMLYSLQGEDVSKFNLTAPRFYYQTSRARYLLLNWIARHIDQAERAELGLPADETPETWLADLQVKVESAARAPMSRVLDVSKTGGMQVGEGGFTAQIIDPLCPWNQGAWRLEAEGGRLRVTRSDQAGCELAIQGLTALIAGTHDPADFALRGWGIIDPAKQSTLRGMFPPMLPHMHEVF